MKQLHLLGWAVLSICVGCSSQNAPQSKEASVRTYQDGLAVSGMAKRAGGEGMPNGSEEGVFGSEADAGATAVPLARKIIRTADIKLIVNDFDNAEKELRKLFGETRDCYVSQAEITGTSGSPRQGMWKVRVPVGQFEAFRAAIVQLGIPEINRLDSQDVTEAYYNVEAHIKNKKIAEERLQKLLEKSTGKLEDVLAVEREISRVRGEIEQQEGRLRLLANLTELTTITITIREIKNFIPPQAPTFASTLSSTFIGSIGMLIDLGKALVIILVALTPWVPVLVLVGLPAWWLLRRSSVGRGPAPLPPAS